MYWFGNVQAVSWGWGKKKPSDIYFLLFLKNLFLCLYAMRLQSISSMFLFFNDLNLFQNYLDIFSLWRTPPEFSSWKAMSVLFSWESDTNMDYENANYFSIIGTTDCNQAFPKALFPQKKMKEHLTVIVLKLYRLLVSVTNMPLVLKLSQIMLYLITLSYQMQTYITDDEK